MRRLAFFLALIAAPAGAVMPAVTEDALDPARTASAAESLIACLRTRPGAAVIGARVIGAVALNARLREPGGRVLNCHWQPDRGATVAPSRPEDWPMAGEGPRVFTLDRLCPGSDPVNGPDGRPLGWLSPSDCR